MICPRCGHPNLPDRRTCSLCNTPLQGVISTHVSSGALPTFAPPPSDPFVPVTRPKADTLIEPLSLNEEDERTFAGDLDAQTSHDGRSENLEWDMEELNTLSSSPPQAQDPHTNKASSIPIGPVEPSPTEKNTAPGMLPFSSAQAQHPRDSQEMTISVKGSQPTNDEDDLDFDATLNRATSPLPKHTSMRDTTPRSPKSAEHTFALATPLVEDASKQEEERYFAPTEEINKADLMQQGLTVPAVLSVAPFERPSAPPTQEDSFPPIPPFHQPTTLHEKTREETMPPSQSHQSSTYSIHSATEKQDVSMFQHEQTNENARPEQETFRDEPMTAHAIARKPLPKPRLKPGFVFAEQLTLPSLWRRAVAAFIDLSLLAGLAFLSVRLFGPAVTKSPPANLHPLDLMVFALEHYSQHVSFGVVAFSLLYVLYTMAGLLLLRGSLGKSLLGLEVVDRSGNKLGFLSAMVRSIAFLPSFFLGLVGVFWILMDNEFRGLYDRVAGSVVVRK